MVFDSHFIESLSLFPVAVKNYLEKGVNPNISNVDGLTPLHRVS